MKHFMPSLLRSFIVIVGLLVLWQGCVQFFSLPHYILPSPARVLLILFQQQHLIAIHTLPTLIETIAGFLLGIIFGCTAAMLIAISKPLSRWLLPLLIMSQAIPIFALAPVLVIWLGYGLASKIITTAIMIFFPIASAFYDGLRKTPIEWMNLAQTMNSHKWRTFYTIRMPAALPTLASGIRVAAVTAPIGAIVSEWVGSSSGLGYLMLNANARMQIDLMFAAVIVMMLLALILYVSVDKLLNSLVWWT